MDQSGRLGQEILRAAVEVSTWPAWAQPYHGGERQSDVSEHSTSSVSPSSQPCGDASSAKA